MFKRCVWGVKMSYKVLHIYLDEKVLEKFVTKPTSSVDNAVLEEIRLAAKKIYNANNQINKWIEREKS